MTFVHRFTSPEWLRTLETHLAGASSLSNSGSEDNKRNIRKIFGEIVNLDVGEALVFSPSAMLDVVGGGRIGGRMGETGERIEKLGTGYLKVRIRKRITADGGKSILAV